MRSVKEVKHSIEDALIAAGQLMRSQGISKDDAINRFGTTIDRIYKQPNTPKLGAAQISRLADVCARWFIESDYTDRNGHPIPLTWNGRSGTLALLVSQVLGARHAKAVAKELVDRKLVRKHEKGGWVPVSQVIAPDGFKSAESLRGASMIIRLAQTLGCNRSKRYKGNVLLEVMAQVPRLPSKELNGFRRFTKAQGLIFAKSVDDWLETRSLKRDLRRNIPTRQAGVVAFAFIDPEMGNDTA